VNWSSDKVRELFGGIKVSGTLSIGALCTTNSYHTLIIANPASETDSSSATHSTSEPTTPDTTVAVIIGATLSALSTVCLLALLTWYLVHRRKKHSQPPEDCSGGSQAPEHWQFGDGNGGTGLNDINGMRGAEFYELDGQHNKAVE
jgi:hypothetical protein